MRFGEIDERGVRPTDLMSFQRVLSCKRFTTTTIAEERFLAGVRVSVPLQVVLAVEGERTHVAGKRPLRGCGVLRCPIRVIRVDGMRLVLRHDILTVLHAW